MTIIGLLCTVIGAWVAHSLLAASADSIHSQTGDEALSGGAAQPMLGQEEQETAAAAPLLAVEPSEDYGGSWVGDGGFVRDGVTDEAMMDQVDAAELDTQLVEWSEAELETVMDRMNAAATADPEAFAGTTGWYVDLITNAVVVETANAAGLSAYLEQAGLSTEALTFTDAVESWQTVSLQGAERYETQFTVGTGLCSIGFAVEGGFVTAGHCTEDIGRRVWNSTQTELIGHVERRNNVGGDAAFIRLDPGHVVRPEIKTDSGTVEIHGSLNAPVGATVCRSGASTGTRCGPLITRNSSELLNGVLKTNMVRAGMCSTIGDSGGPLYWGNQAQGVLARTNSSCEDLQPNAWSSFHPVNEILSEWGLTLKTAGGNPPPGPGPVEPPPGPVEPPPGPVEPPPGPGFVLRAGHSGKCLEAAGGVVVQRTCSGAASQRFTENAAGGGIVLVASNGQCVGPLDGSRANGAKIVTSSCGGAGQAFVRSGDRYRGVDSNRCLDIPGSGSADGVQVIQWDCHNSANQKFTRNDAAPGPGPVEPPPAPGNAALRASHSGLCVDVGNGSAVQQACNGAAEQQFTLTGSGELKTSDGKCLDIAGGSTRAGAEVLAWSCHGGANQKFDRQNGTYRARHSNMCLDVEGGSRNTGARVLQWNCNGGANQNFS
ncbi:MAG: ricin-type beta-trefoil lectin domain protein [Acidimicrobiales bacterium]